MGAAGFRTWANRFSAWGSALTVVVALLSIPSGSISKQRLLAIIVLGGLCLILGAIGHGYIKLSIKRKDLLKSGVVLVAILAGTFLFGWLMWPPKVFCYIKPISEGISGVVLAMNNSGPTSIHGVSFTMIEIPTGAPIQKCTL